MAKPTGTDTSEFDRQNERAIRAAREADRVEPRAAAVACDSAQALILVQLRSGFAFGSRPTESPDSMEQPGNSLRTAGSLRVTTASIATMWTFKRLLRDAWPTPSISRHKPPESWAGSEAKRKPGPHEKIASRAGVLAVRLNDRAARSEQGAGKSSSEAPHPRPLVPKANPLGIRCARRRRVAASCSRDAAPPTPRTSPAAPGEPWKASRGRSAQGA